MKNFILLILTSSFIIGFGKLYAQNVGISDNPSFTTPNYLLHLHRNAASGIMFQMTNTSSGTTGTDGFYINMGAGFEVSLINRENANIGLYTNNLQRAIISSYGFALNNSTYINFSSTLGDGGYGLRSNLGVLEYKNSGGSWSPFPSPPPIPGNVEWWIRPTGEFYIRPALNPNARVFDDGQDFGYFYEGSNDVGAFFSGSDMGAVSTRSSASDLPGWTSDDFPFDDGGDGDIDNTDLLTWSGFYAYGNYYVGQTGIGVLDAGIRGIALDDNGGTNSSWPVAGVLGEVLYDDSGWSGEYGQQGVYGWNSAPPGAGEFCSGVLGRTSQTGAFSAGVVGYYSNTVGNLTTCFTSSQSYGLIGTSTDGGRFFGATYGLYTTGNSYGIYSTGSPTGGYYTGTTRCLYNYFDGNSYSYIGGSNTDPSNTNYFYKNSGTTTDNDNTIYAYKTRSAQNDGISYAYSGTNEAIQGYVYWGDVYNFGVSGHNYNDYNRTGGVIGAVSGGTYWGSLGYKSSGGTTYGGYFTSTGTGLGKSTLYTSAGIAAHGGLLGADIHGDVYGLYVEGNNYAIYSHGDVIRDGLDVHLQASNEEFRSTGDGNMNVLYTSVSTDVTIQTCGTGQLINGLCYISFNDVFKSTVSDSEPIVISVTLTQSCSNSLFIESSDKNGFTVRENNEGSSNSSFMFIAIGKRAGFESPELPNEIVSSDYNLKMKQGLKNDNNIADDANGLYYENGELYVGKHSSVTTISDSKDSGAIETENAAAVQLLEKERTKTRDRVLRKQEKESNKKKKNEK
ncbi:MAG: hypothetical protein JXR58_07525 [Bacteroidales bacterium]|nr:hypothetical protein [Bacteroidales bacterium]